MGGTFTPFSSRITTNQNSIRYCSRFYHIASIIMQLSSMYVKNYFYSVGYVKAALVNSHYDIAKSKLSYCSMFTMNPLSDLLAYKYKDQG